MENAIDALKLAAAVIIFVIALAVSITAFSGARIASETLLDYRDREFWLGESGWYRSASDKQRVVGMETIIPSIYRAYSAESYKIVFLDENNDPYELYECNGENNVRKKVNTMGLIPDNKNLGGMSLNQREDIINRILYGIDDNDTIEKLEIGPRKVKFKDTDDNLYDYINNHMFYEYSGVYYRGEEEGKSSSPEINRKEIRVITYKTI